MSSLMINHVHHRDDFDQSNQLSIYRSCEYDSYEAALKDGAVYQTGSTMDDLETTGGGSIGFDIAEVLGVAADCQGLVTFKGGILNKHGQFVEIPFTLED